MDYVIGILAVLVLVLVTIVICRMKKKKKILQREAQRKQLISTENAVTKEIYASSAWLEDNFQLKYIGKRLVMHGRKDGMLLVAKYKDQKLRVGIPWEFNTKERYYDVEANFNGWEDKALFNTMGSENFYLYLTYLN
mgnify:CR=1 FL=1